MATTDNSLSGADSAIIAQSFGISTANCSSFAGFLDSTGFLVMVHVLKPVTVTGVMFVQTQQGSYAADNYNGIGLYSFSSPNLTLIASSTNDGTLWKQGAPSLKKQPFSSTVALQAGVFWICALYNSSAQTIQPQIAGAPAVSAGILRSLDLVGASTYAFTSSIAALPSTINLSTMATCNQSPWLALC